MQKTPAGRFIPPYENPEWKRWEAILSTEIVDAADFDEVMTRLHGEKYVPKSFSNFLYSYYLGENEGGVFGDIDPGISINHRPENKKIDKKYLFAVILPFIQDMVIKCPDIMYSFMVSKLDHSIPMNKLSKDDILEALRKENAVYPLVPHNPSASGQNIMIPRVHIVSILACAFFGLFDLYDCRDVTGEVTAGAWGGVNFLNFIQDNNAAAFECIVNYFSRVRFTLPMGNIIIRRVNTTIALRASKENDIWTRNSPLSRVRLYTNILAENSPAGVQLILTRPSGGGVSGALCNLFTRRTLTSSVNDEYVRFLIHPELFILPIFVESLTENESLIVLGVETYSSVIYSEKAIGSNAIKYSGEYHDPVQRVKNGTPARTLIFVYCEDPGNTATQYLDGFKNTLDAIRVSVNQVIPHPMFDNFTVNVSVGPWSELQFIQLLLASSVVGNCRIHYHKNDMLESNKNPNVISDIENFMNWLIKKNSGMKAVIAAYNKFSQDLKRDRDNNYGEYDLRTMSIFEEIKKRY